MIFNLGDNAIEKNTYTTRDVLGTFTADGTYELDFSGYKYIEVSLSASNIYGAREIIDAGLIRSGLVTGWNTLYAGMIDTESYYARVHYLLSPTSIQIKYLSSPQANKAVSVVGIK